MKRLQNLRKLLKKEKLDAVVISGITNIEYYSGFTGSVALLLVKKNKAFLFVDGRYIEQANKEVENINIIGISTQENLWTECVQYINKLKVKSLGYEDNRITVDVYNKFKDKLSKVKLIPVGKKLDLQRIIKDKDEIKLIRESSRICSLTYDCVRRIIKVGMTEKEVANEVNYLMRTMGAEDSSFGIMVSSGINTSFPHGKPTNKVIKKGDLVQLDFGAKYQGYSSDISRVLVAIHANEKQKKIYDAVLGAQKAAIKVVKGGVSARKVDEAARNYLKKHKLDKYFRHSTGHGVGLAIHEAPRVSIKNDLKIKSGMVFTIEPGVYLPGWGGVRIEDMVLVTKKGCDILTNVSKELEVFS